MNWIMLITAGFFEIVFTTSLGHLKNTTGTSYAIWIAVMILSMSLSLFLLYKATFTIPIGTAYAIWTGIGAAGTVIAGIVFFKEEVTFWRIFFITILIASIIGLKLSEKPFQS